MADTEYSDDVQFAGLVQAATAAADEQTRSTGLGKRKRAEVDDVSNIDPSMTAEDDLLDVQLQNSAAVLFREPSQKSKKYSRPPLGKVYASLELAPETFLKLQSAGKDFMLDPEHPERRDVVGHRRHSGGTDIAKLKLWQCVEEFLRDAGNGEKFFGAGAGRGIPDAPERTMYWPDDAQKIIRGCMPLMRKMVTNERQRQYAADTRKSRADKIEDEQGQFPLEQHLDHIVLDHGSHQDNGFAAIGTQTQQEPTTTEPAPLPSLMGSVTLLINLMTSDSKSLRRIIPRFTLPPESAANLPSLRAQIKNYAKNTSAKKIDQAIIQVWLTDGLVKVTNDGEWMVALLSAGTVEWMDGEVRVLVQV